MCYFVEQWLDHVKVISDTLVKRRTSAFVAGALRPPEVRHSADALPVAIRLTLTAKGSLAISSPMKASFDVSSASAIQAP